MNRMTRDEIQERAVKILMSAGFVAVLWWIIKALDGKML
jgi:hypothetical protein